jgi:hypothetical protein
MNVKCRRLWVDENYRNSLRLEQTLHYAGQKSAWVKFEASLGACSRAESRNDVCDCIVYNNQNAHRERYLDTVEVV